MRAKLLMSAMGLLALLPRPAAAVDETALRTWLKGAGPMVLTNDPARFAAMMEAKAPYFTPEGLNGFKNALEQSGAAQQPMQVAILCVANVRMAEGGTWIADTQVVYRKPQTAPEAPSTDPNAPPKAKANPYYYHEGQFYIKDNDVPAGLKINQYIAKAGPKEGFTTCRAPNEMNERLGPIDEQLAFYEKTSAALQEKITDLKAQKEALLTGKPMPEPKAVAAPVPTPQAQTPPAQPYVENTAQTLQAPQGTAPVAPPVAPPAYGNAPAHIVNPPSEPLKPWQSPPPAAVPAPTPPQMVQPVQQPLQEPMVFQQTTQQVLGAPGQPAAQTQVVVTPGTQPTPMPVAPAAPAVSPQTPAQAAPAPVAIPAQPANSFARQSTTYVETR